MTDGRDRAARRGFGCAVKIVEVAKEDRVVGNAGVTREFSRESTLECHKFGGRGNVAGNLEDQEADHFEREDPSEGVCECECEGEWVAVGLLQVKILAV